MSEYTLPAEVSVSVAVTASNLVPVYQSGALKKATVLDVFGNPTISGGTFSAPTINNPVVNGATWNGNFSVSSSAVIGTTKSAKIGLWGAAGTSQRSGSAQAAFSGSAFSPTTASSVVGFSSSAQFVNLYTLVNEMRQALIDVGIINGS